MFGLDSGELIALGALSATFLFSLLAYKHSHNQFALQLFDKRSAALARINYLHMKQWYIYKEIVHGYGKDIGVDISEGYRSNLLKNNINDLRDAIKDLTESHIYEYKLLFGSSIEHKVNLYIACIAKVQSSIKKSMDDTNHISELKEIFSISNDFYNILKGDMLQHMKIGEHTHKNLLQLLISSPLQTSLRFVKWPYLYCRKRLQKSPADPQKKP